MSAPVKSAGGGVPWPYDTPAEQVTWVLSHVVAGLLVVAGVCLAVAWLDRLVQRFHGRLWGRGCDMADPPVDAWSDVVEPDTAGSVYRVNRDHAADRVAEAMGTHDDPWDARARSVVDIVLGGDRP